MSDELDIPSGWEKVKLDELIIRMTNGANVIQFDEKIGFPISRIETIWNQGIDLSRVKYIKESDPEFIEKYKLRDNDILFSHINSDSHIGKTAIFKIEKTCTIIHGINLLLLRPSKEISAALLNYQFNYLRSKGSFAAVAQKAVNQSSINQAKLKQFDFFVPPLAEQHRIVTKLEELFSSLDKAIERITTAKQQLKVYRQAVLKYAFEGRFTNDNLKDGEMPKGWATVKLGSIFVETPQNGVYKPSTMYGTGVRIMRIDGFYDGNLLDTYQYKRLQLSEEEIKKYKLEINDLLINRVNSMSYLGKCGLVKKLSEVTVFESNIMRTKLNLNLAKPKYISNYLSSKNGLEELRKNAKQAVNQASINQTDVANVEVPLPLPPEQILIVEEIESRLSVCDKIEEGIENSLLKAEALRQSILTKAFEGKLVPQDPSDEPARKLIERIRTEREKHEGAKVKKERKIKI